MANKETWVAKDVETPVHTETVSAVAEPKKPFFDRFSSFVINLLNIVVTFFIAALISAGSYLSYPALNPPSFTQAQSYFDSKGDTEAGEHLSELAKVCQDGSKTELACKLVYFSGINELKGKPEHQNELSQITFSQGGKH